MSAESECIGDERCAVGERCVNGTCVINDCASNDDCSSVCVDGMCSEGYPNWCNIQEDCANDNLTCGQAGGCFLSAPCVSSADCGQTFSVCDFGQCVQCVYDIDCPGQGFCNDRQCRDAECASDEDCVGDRTCVGGMCAPVQCEGDRFDGPNSVSLASGYHSALTLCDGDEDLYQVAVPSGKGLRVILIPHDDQEEHGLILKLGASDFAQISETRSGRAQLSMVPKPVARDLEVSIEGSIGRSVTYSLIVEFTETGDCHADELTTPLGNDSVSVSPLWSGRSLVGSLCLNDVDHYKVALDAGTRIALDVVSESSDRRVIHCG